MTQYLNNKRGSAIIMVLVTITILLVLGMAVVTLSLGTLTANNADATTNDTYYAAEAGINSAIAQVKTEVVKYYAQMSDPGSDYTSLYTNFYANIASNASSRFNEPSIQHMTTSTAFSAGNINEGANTGDILISCEATAADGTKYVVNGSVSVQRIDLRSGGGDWFIDDVALYSGGTLHVSHWYSGITPSNATVVCSQYSPPNWAKAGGASYNVLVDANAADAIGDLIPYPSYSNPALGSNVKEFAAGAQINNASGVPEGIIYGRGDLRVASWSTVYKDIYCDGNLTISNTGFNGNIYCRGNLSFSGGSGFSGKIICDGNITISGCDRSGLITAGGSITASGGANSCSFYAVGPIDISGGSSGADGGVIYSCTQLKISGGNAHGIYFSGGEIFANSNGTTLFKSVLIAKGTIHANNLTLSYDKSYTDSILNDPDNAFFFGGGSGSSGAGGGGSTPTSDVILGQTISAAGRTN